MTGVPGIIEGVPVQIVITGKIYALAPGGKPGKPDKKPPKESIVDPKDRFDPILIGISTGNANSCSAGTIGCIVYDDSYSYALSNNHVFALMRDDLSGSEIMQPGLYDTRCVYDENNIIGHLSAWAFISTVDAAIAILDGPRPFDICTPVGGYGTPNSIIHVVDEFDIGIKVQKYGRTSLLTEGTIEGISATIDVSYGSFVATFDDQIFVYSRRKPVIKSGDSGSLLVTQDDENYPVGLLFAGDSSGKFAWANRIENVLDEFEIDISGK